MQKRVEERCRPTGQQRVDQHEVCDCLDPESRVDSSARRQPLELGSEEELEGIPKDKDRDRYPEQGNDGDYRVRPALREAGCHSAERNAQTDRKDQRRDCQLDRRRKASAKLLDDGSVVDDALAEIEPAELAEVDRILLIEGLVEAHLLTDLDGQLWGGVLPKQGRDRIAR